MALTKQDIVETIRLRTGASRTDAAATVEALLKVIKDTLASGEDALVSGFGKFRVNDKAERIGRNPATGESMMLAPRRVVTFKPSGILRDQVNHAGADIP